MEITKCIICDSDENLNTFLSLTVDDKKCKVPLCDEHAEDTTPKQAKTALQKKMSALEEMIKAAEAMGLKIVNPSEEKKIIVAEEQPVPVQAKRIERLPDFKSVSGTTEGIAVAGHASIAVESEVKKTINEMKQIGAIGKDVGEPSSQATEAQVLNTSTRGSIVLPKKLEGNIGTTDIKMTQTDDRQLQDRFKSDAEQSVRTDQPTLSSQIPYKNDAVVCTFCRGTGMSRIGRQACAKCNGAGLIIAD